MSTQAIRHWQQRAGALTAELPESEERTGLRLGACTNRADPGRLAAGALGGGDGGPVRRGPRARGARRRQRGAPDSHLRLRGDGLALRETSGATTRWPERPTPWWMSPRVPRCTDLRSRNRAYSSFLLGRIDEALRLAAEMPDVAAGDPSWVWTSRGFSLLALELARSARSTPRIAGVSTMRAPANAKPRSWRVQEMWGRRPGLDTRRIRRDREHGGRAGRTGARRRSDAPPSRRWSSPSRSAAQTHAGATVICTWGWRRHSTGTGTTRSMCLETALRMSNEHHGTGLEREPADSLPAGGSASRRGRSASCAGQPPSRGFAVRGSAGSSISRR